MYVFRITPFLLVTSHPHCPTLLQSACSTTNVHVYDYNSHDTVLSTASPSYHVILHYAIHSAIRPPFIPFRFLCTEQYTGYFNIHLFRPNISISPLSHSMALQILLLPLFDSKKYRKVEIFLGPYSITALRFMVYSEILIR